MIKMNNHIYLKTELTLFRGKIIYYELKNVFKLVLNLKLLVPRYTLVDLLSEIFKFIQNGEKLDYALFFTFLKENEKISDKYIRVEVRAVNELTREPINFTFNFKLSEHKTLRLLFKDYLKIALKGYISSLDVQLNYLQCMEHMQKTHIFVYGVVIKVIDQKRK
uniref:Uncharacterized protein n=1 Tax=Fomitiporia mediterranea TaxID=208960 RepID=A0A5B9RCN5_9AGAM|nr:hypothetical protein Fomme_000053 [Fomitiporia mediterranea]QEG57049.1 hypothetical protein Fomme_000053 [Fomitiporia mediterranea]